MPHFQTEMKKYHAMISEALKQMRVAKTFAEDGAAADAGRCAREAADIFDKASKLKRTALEGLIDKK